MCHYTYSAEMLPAGLSLNSSLVSASLSSALSLNVTAVSNSSTSDTDGAQLTNYTLTTAAVDDDTAVLSGNGMMQNHMCHMQNLAIPKTSCQIMHTAASTGTQADILWMQSLHSKSFKLAAFCNACISKQHSLLRKLPASCLQERAVQRLSNFAFRPTERNLCRISLQSDRLSRLQACWQT